MRISVLHFSTNDVEAERFREHTNIYIDKLFNVKFDVYHRDQVSAIRPPKRYDYYKNVIQQTFFVLWLSSKMSTFSMLDTSL